jgi:4-amino-4-deoxy-L-arabinose transferase-like glycosyltransferase
MTFLTTTVDRLETVSTRLLDRLALSPRLAAAALLVLALLSYLPGMLALPPVDRTEVVYAQASRDMIRRGDMIDATYEGERAAFRPIGIHWMQIASGKVLGKSAQRAIATYRLPSLLAGVLAVLAMWWLARPLIGDRRALISAALFAVTPIVALQAQLSIPEGPLLLALVVAQVALLRLYCDPAPRSILPLALVFWAAQGFGMLINALAVPILSLSTLVALVVFDRNVSWLKRLRPLLGVPLMLVIAAPWLLIRAHFDGVLFSGLTFWETLTALGGAQDMKWKAAPFTFTLALLLGSMPAALLLVPTVRNLWDKRAETLHRFLFCWLVGYLAYLELIASKPALYTVQAMFPAVAIAATLALDKDGRLALPDYMLRLPAWLVFPSMAALFIGVVWIAGATPTVPVIVGAILVTALFTIAAHASREKRAAAWLVTSIVGFAVFLGFTFGVLLPSLKVGWPAARIAEAVRPLQRCVVGPIGVVGFREPSTNFVLGRNAETNLETIAARMAGGEESIAVVEDRWHGELAKQLEAREATLPARAGCVEAFNVMRGCPLSFSIYVTGKPQLDPGCKLRPEFTCAAPPPASSPPRGRCH